jgi:hypothetical protein
LVFICQFLIGFFSFGEDLRNFNDSNLCPLHILYLEKYPLLDSYALWSNLPSSGSSAWLTLLLRKVPTSSPTETDQYSVGAALKNPNSLIAVEEELGEVGFYSKTFFGDNLFAMFPATWFPSSAGAPRLESRLIRYEGE